MASHRTMVRVCLIHHPERRDRFAVDSGEGGLFASPLTKR